MSSFTEFSAPLRIQFDPEASQILGANHWRVTEPFQYRIGSLDSKQWVTVPAGYLTDGASVPRALWSLIPPWGAYGQAAVVHDLLCEYLTIVDDGLPARITRERADQIFLEAMTVLNVPPGISNTMFQAVGLYRRVTGAEEPTTTPVKRKLESAWA